MKHAEQTDNDGNSSFISDVLDFVSRELNHFVANATGVAVAVVRPQSCHIRPSDDRRKTLKTAESAIKLDRQSNPEFVPRWLTATLLRNTSCT